MDPQHPVYPTTNPRHISGIHNYCDRWCERCAFTSRCAVYAMDQAEPPADDEKDLRNAAFWKRLETTFQLALDMLRQRLREYGVDPDDLDIDEASEREERRRKAAAGEPYVTLSTQYLRACQEWLDGNDSRLERFESELQTANRIGTPNTNPSETGASVTEAIEVVAWYQTLIPVKLRRAAEGVADTDASPAEYLQQDFNGSAKVALIAIDRSLAAWQALLEHFDEEEDQILMLLAQLDRLRRHTEARFPHARAFKRPGFDD